MDERTQAALARQAAISRQHLNDCLKGRRNAAGLAALNLAELTGTDPRLWLRGGDIQKRRMAFNKWSES